MKPRLRWVSNTDKIAPNANSPWALMIHRSTQRPVNFSDDVFAVAMTSLVLHAPARALIHGEASSGPPWWQSVRGFWYAS